MSGWVDEITGKLGFGTLKMPPAPGNDNPCSGPVDYEQANKLFDEMLDAGLNYVDTAHTYGDAEDAVRKCLAERHPCDSFFLTNKLSTEYFETTDEITPLLESQLERCGVEYFDMLLMHAQTANAYEKFLRCDAYRQALEFVAAGKARHFGISFHDTADVLERILNEQPAIEAVQLQLNYEDWESPSIQSRKCYELCVERGLPVLVMEPVKGGILADLPENAQVEMDKIWNPEGLSNAGFALRFAASWPGVVMVLSGTHELDMMRENIRCMANAAPLSEDQMAGLQKVHEALAAANQIPCTACHYCVSRCPRSIMIPEVLRCLNDERAHPSWNAGWYYHQSFTKGEHSLASECIRCGACEANCPQKLPIINLLEQVAETFECPGPWDD